MLLDDYNALVIGHTGCAVIHEKSAIRKFSAFFRKKAVCEKTASPNFKNMLQNNQLIRGVTSITNHRAIETWNLRKS